MITRPNTTLPPWGDTGDKIQPVAPDIATGFPHTDIKPTRQTMNWALNYASNASLYLTLRGIPDWDASSNYIPGDVCRSKGKFYSATNNTTNQEPSISPAQWQLLYVFQSDLNTLFLTPSQISQTYLTQNSASSTYETIAQANSSHSNLQNQINAITTITGKGYLPGPGISITTDGSGNNYINNTAVQVNADWNASSGPAQIINKPPIQWDAPTDVFTFLGSMNIMPPSSGVGGGTGTWQVQPWDQSTTLQAFAPPGKNPALYCGGNLSGGGKPHLVIQNALDVWGGTTGITLYDANGSVAGLQFYIPTTGNPAMVVSTGQLSVFSDLNLAAGHVLLLRSSNNTDTATVGAASTGELALTSTKNVQVYTGGGGYFYVYSPDKKSWLTHYLGNSQTPALSSSTGTLAVTSTLNTNEVYVYPSGQSAPSLHVYSQASYHPILASSTGQIVSQSQFAVTNAGGFVVFSPDGSRYGQFNCANTGNPTFQSSTGWLGWKAVLQILSPDGTRSTSLYQINGGDFFMTTNGASFNLVSQVRVVSPDSSRCLAIYTNNGANPTLTSTTGAFNLVATVYLTSPDYSRSIAVLIAKGGTPTLQPNINLMYVNFPGGSGSDAALVIQNPSYGYMSVGANSSGPYLYSSNGVINMRGQTRSYDPGGFVSFSPDGSRYGQFNTQNSADPNIYSSTGWLVVNAAINCLGPAQFANLVTINNGALTINNGSLTVNGSGIGLYLPSNQSDGAIGVRHPTYGQVNMGVSSSGPYIWTTTGALSLSAQVSIGNNLIVTGSVNCTIGYICRAGGSGNAPGQYFNFNWTGSGYIDAWIGTTYIGKIQMVSDYRLKHNIKPLDKGALLLVDRLRPVSFNWRAVENDIFSGSDETHFGLVAHELQAVIPSAVSGEKDALTSTGTIQPQSINQTDLLAVIIAAIQELSAKVNKLERMN